MNRIHERIKPINVLAPKEQEAGKSDFTACVDGADCTSIDFIITNDGGEITAELFMADEADGSGAESLGISEFETGGLYVVSTQVRGDWKRFYGVKITNDGTEDAAVAVIAIVEVRHTDELNNFETLIVK